jgi:hypothetical protein
MMKDRFQHPAAPSADSAALLPPVVRRWVTRSLGLVLALALYLIAVRGTAIIFDLGDAISAFCF